MLNGGNPTAAVDPFETPQYPVGVQPDAKYQRPILDLGLHRSANGIDEYTLERLRLDDAGQAADRRVLER